MAAHEAGIPIINVDAAVYDEELVACIVASDNLSAGLLCAEDMLKRLPKGGKAVILGHPTTKTGIDRIANFKKTIEAHPEFKIAAEDSSEGQLEIAMPKMENIIQAVPDMSVVMCVNDPTALGTIQALRAANALEGVLIYGVDGSPDAKKMIKEGLMTGTAAQSPINIGKIGVEMAYKILAGEKVEKHIPVPVQLITAENVDEFGVDGWQ
jgi:ribose transport system substrate-binding protein